MSWVSFQYIGTYFFSGNNDCEICPTTKENCDYLNKIGYDI